MLDAVAEVRDQRTGRFLGVDSEPRAAAEAEAPISAPTEDEGPGRAIREDRVRAWAIVALFALLAVVLVGAALVVAVSSSDAGSVVALCFAAAWPGVRAVELGLRASSLSSGRGRFVFLDEQRNVKHTSNRWYVPTLSRRRATGHWFHVTDAETEAPLGWVEVSGRAAHRLRHGSVCALFGGGPDGLRGLVFTGPFRPVRSNGDLRAELPEDPGWGQLARASRSRWWRPR